MSTAAREALSAIQPRFVFVVGCQRSGTTLMGQIIGAHPSALLVDETDGVYERMDSIFHPTDDRTRADQIRQLCMRATTKYRGIVQPESILVLQTPNLTWSHTQISNCLPNARVVYMLRDVRAVVASMLRLSKIPFVENQIRFFRQTGFIETEFPEEWKGLLDEEVRKPIKMALIAKIKMSLAEKFESVGLPVLQVRYEDLVSVPRETISRVTRYIGIPFDEGCLEHNQVLRGYGPGGTDRTRSIDTRSIMGWREHLMPEIEESIWAAVGEFYEELGYARLDRSNE